MMFFAVVNKRTAAVKALLEVGAGLEVINNWHHTRVSVAFSRRHTHAGMVPVVLQEAGNSMKQRGRQDIIAAKNTGPSIGNSGEYAVL
mmetsp:Transcript_78504/g.129884  ORF Transcript_78504/g.129884 Transcript_78504/m.129884 type:complete len:88 (+) Transcript_78504:258-521(+)